MVNNQELHNEDELNAPEWMNKEFLSEVLKDSESSKDVKIKDYVITPGTSKSDHYASIMFRAKVNYSIGKQDKSKSMIIKAMPTVESQKNNTMGETKFFETEIKMYSETLPKIEALLRKYGDSTKLCAKILYHSLKPRQIVIFEDLVERGYTTISKRCCTMEEVQAALLKLSRLHAVSYKLAKESDSTITAFNKGLFNSIDVNEFELTGNAIKLFKEIISQHNDLKEYIPHIENIETGLLEKCVSFFDAFGQGERDGILVLNHGDFHMKNMMIQYSDGKLNDLMLLDYQTSFFGSAAIDVIYHIVMLMSPEMRRYHRDELLYFYFTNFQETLKATEYLGRIPTMSDFQAELAKHKDWEIFMVFSFLILNYLFTDDMGDLAKAFEDEEYRRKFYENPAFLNELRILLPRYLHQGYFEKSNQNIE